MSNDKVQTVAAWITIGGFVIAVGTLVWRAMKA